MKDDKVYLKHILEIMEEVRYFLTLKTDRKLMFRAIERNIGIIGEAANRVSRDLQKSFPEINWKDIIGSRHKLIHDYFEIEEDKVWYIAEHDLPELEGQIRNILEYPEEGAQADG